MADASSQETRIKSGVPQGSVIGILLLVLFANDFPSIINGITLLFADDVRVDDLLQSSLYNDWNWPVNWDLSINPNKRNYIAIGRDPPRLLSLSTGSLGDSIQVATVVKDLGVLMDNSFSPSNHCTEAASKARRMLFMIRRSFAVLSVSGFVPPL